MTQEITQEQVRSLLDYNPATGVFIWRFRAGSDIGTKIFNGRFPGTRADTLRPDGYTRIRLTVNGKYRSYQAHRLAWLYVHGDLPEYEIDHINRNRTDNRLANLRPATSAENKRNVPARKTNKSGYKGVVDASAVNPSKPWCAYIQINRKNRNLGYFYTKQEASAAYKAASLSLHGEFSTFATT